MSLHVAAQHLASKGRNGDTTLVHMTKGEVAGLQALAQKNGTSLTVNPQTGLPEAFSLKSLLPMAAGFMLGGPMGMSAMTSALTVGGISTLATGSLKQGLIAGLGAYGGAGLGSGVGSVTGAEGAGAGTGAGGVPVTDAVPTPAETIQAGGSAAPATQQYAGAYQPTSFSSAPADLATETQAYAPTQTNYGAFGDAPTTTGYESPAVADATQQQASASYGTQTAYQNPTQNPNMGSFDKVATNAEANPKLLGYAAAPGVVEELTPKPYEPEKPNVDADMGQRYSFDPGYSNALPGRTGPAAYNQISNEAARKLYGYADGGEIQYPAGESVLRMADGGFTGYEAGGPSGDYSGYGPSNLSGNYTGYDAAPNQGIVALQAPQTPQATSVAAPEHGYAYDPATQRFVGANLSNDMEYQGGGAYGMSKAALEKAAQDAANAFVGQYDSGGYAAGGGISTLGGYSDGGRLLKGPGDGMSDNIPAKIGAKQPARLADGEFVVPADVVSHLGNGSTDAGAKQLYKMMDKIRTARTGRKAQGKQINPNKYLPA